MGGRGASSSASKKGTVFKKESEAELYAANKLRRAGISRYEQLPALEGMSNASRRTAQEVTDAFFEGRSPNVGRITKKTASDALKIVEHKDLSNAKSFLSARANIDYKQYGHVVSVYSKAKNFLKGRK